MNHRKIAELAHVSTSTVSKALSGSREVSNEIAELVRKIALETGYFNEKNKRKAENKRKNDAQISVLCPEIISIHYSRIVTQLKNFIEERGGKVAVYIYDFDADKLNDIIKYLSIKMETDGIILLSARNVNIPTTIPIVSFDISSSDCNYDTISVNMSDVFSDIVSFLSKTGHREIGFIGETHTMSKQLHFENAMSKHNIKINPDYIYCIENRFEGIGVEAARQIIEKNLFPTAFITAYDEIAISLIHNLQKAGIRVPEDISIFGMNDIPLAPYIKSSLSTVKFFYDEQAALAVDILYDKIFDCSSTVQHLIVQHELIIRESTSPRV